MISPLAYPPAIFTGSTQHGIASRPRNGKAGGAAAGAVLVGAFTVEPAVGALASHAQKTAATKR